MDPFDVLPETDLIPLHKCFTEFETRILYKTSSEDFVPSLDSFSPALGRLCEVKRVVLDLKRRHLVTEMWTLDY